MVNIYSFTRSSDYLKAVLDNKKQINPSFSMRAWCKVLGFNSNAQLSLIIAGKRALPKKYMPKLIEQLNLNTKQAQFLEALIDYEWSRSESQKSYYQKRLHKLKPKSILMALDESKFQFLSDPLNTILLEMSALKDCPASPEDLKDRLIIDFDVKHIASTLERLFALNLIQKKTNNSFLKTHQHLISIPDISLPAAQEYHAAICDLAKQALLHVPLKDRDYTSFSLNICSERLPEAKKSIQEFCDNFIHEFEANEGTAEKTYQMNVQLFPVTGSSDKK